ncbi:MAG TPA: molybdopterin-dependent oxidoreductase [Anaerolineales bacterium]|nr:molybdopterin-dependent oxidoreductase [Anaerolineales bacterium]
MSIGISSPRIDALGKVTGKTLYPGDITMPNLLHMKVMYAHHPHARLVNIDTRAAEAISGVIAIFTAKDVPVNEYGLIEYDQPVIVGPGSTIAGADVARFEGDVIAIVIAESETIASHAIEHIHTEWQELPFVDHPTAAMQEGAPQLFTYRPNNLLIHKKTRIGNVDAAWNQCAVVVEGYYETPMQEHAFLQPESGVGYLDEEGRITVQVAGQWAHEDQVQVAHALALPTEQVRIIYPAIGGAFGGREDMSVQILLALSVWRLAQRGIHRPIRVIWSRYESMIAHHKRHAYYMKAKWGASADGKILAAECELIQDAGAYAYTSTKVLGNSVVCCIGPYAVPNIKIDAYSVLTNNVPGGAFRGFGGPQGTFLAESQINKLALALGMDPVEFRMRNLIEDGVNTSTGYPAPDGVTIKQVVSELAKQADWKSAELGDGGLDPNKRILHGRGIACAYKNVGFSFGAPEECYATVELRGEDEIEQVIVYHAGSDCGQGAHTVFRQMAAEAAGVSLDKVTLVASDTATSGSSGSASASRMTFMAGNAIKGAVERALNEWQNEERPARVHYRYVPPATQALDPEFGTAPRPSITYGYIGEVVDLEVDVDSGMVRIRHVTVADDVGKAINPQQIEGQIEGCVVQAHGYALMEHIILDKARMRNPLLSAYLIPTVLDVPDQVQSVILEYADPDGPWGVRGMAEMPYLPYPAAVVHAFYNATGIWLEKFPLTPDYVVSKLKQMRRVG